MAYHLGQHLQYLRAVGDVVGGVLLWSFSCGVFPCRHGQQCEL